MGDLKKIQKPLFYIHTRYVRLRSTGHVVAADNGQQALEIAEKYNISYKPFGEVRDRTVEPSRYIHKGRTIWYESHGTLQSWTWTGDSFDPSRT